MGEQDKGLIGYRGKPLAQWVIERLAPQVDELLVSANRNQDAYARFGYPVLADQLPGFAGPLAGIHAGFSRARHPWLLAVPCDSPLLPLDLAVRILAAATAAGAPAAFVRCGERRHPVFCLCRTDKCGDLHAYLSEGERQVAAWLVKVGAVEVDFSDQASAFININTLDDLAASADR